MPRSFRNVPVQVVPVAGVVDLQQALLAETEMLRSVTRVSVGGRDRDGSGRIHRRRDANLAGSSRHAHADHAGAAGTAAHRTLAAGDVQWHMFDILADALQAIVQRVVVSAGRNKAWLLQQGNGVAVVRGHRRGKRHIATAGFIVIVGRGTGEFELGQWLR